jgi:exodeoxyribonuclease VII small subunit
MAKGKKTFAEAIEELEKIVSKVESGQIPLEESIDKYAEGIALVKQCQAILDAAEKKIQLLAKGDDGELAPAGELDEGEDPEPDRPGE